MLDFLSHVRENVEVWAFGVICYPVGKYILLNFGSTLLADAQSVGSKVTETVKAKFAKKPA